MRFCKSMIILFFIVEMYLFTIHFFSRFISLNILMVSKSKTEWGNDEGRSFNCLFYVQEIKSAVLKLNFHFNTERISGRRICCYVVCSRQKDFQFSEFIYLVAAWELDTSTFQQKKKTMRLRWHNGIFSGHKDLCQPLLWFS